VSGVIFLHGASSSGKSTLARALQGRLDEPFWHYSIGHLRDSGVLPSARIHHGEFSWRLMRASFFDGFHRSVAAFADAGNNLILEHILDTPGWAEQLARLLAPHELLLVGLHCSVEELNRREKARGNRQPGSAEADYQSIHRGLAYDLELDAENDLEDNIERVLRRWREPRARSALLAE
jgi:chloramphenicol 3-O phosphotransferase